MSGHNSLLHDAVVKEEKSATTGSAGDKTNTAHVSHNTGALSKCPSPGKSSYLVPVFVSHDSNPHNEVLTYAMLDNQSDITYITDDVAQQVSKPDIKTTIPISTMTSSCQPVVCNRYSGLSVRGYNCSKRLQIDTLYGCVSVPNNHTAPSAEDLSKWEHLADIVDEFPPVLDCEVGMLIGHDCHYALAPVDTVLPICNDDPFAVRTPLGWSLVGPVGKSLAHDTAYSHLVSNVVTDNSSQKSEMISPADVIKQLESGFDMPGDNDPGTYSLEDEEFLSILCDNIEQGDDGLYSMPLPFKGNNPPDMPNNRAQAVARLKGLSQRFKNKEIFTKYNEFMEGLIESGDAEIVPNDELDNSNKWYLPHHNVVNPKKPQKVRVVFDGVASIRVLPLTKLCSLDQI